MGKKRWLTKLIEYINKDSEKENKWLCWNMNIKEDNERSIINEFNNNLKYMQKRKNWNLVYHEIISLNWNDKKVITPEILFSLGRKYLEQRSPNAIAYGKIHMDSDNPHIHLIISANERKSKKKIRLSQSQFSKMKDQLEQFQRQEYPELEASMVNHGARSGEVKEKKKGSFFRTKGEREKVRRQKKASWSGIQQNQKDLVASILKTHLQEATTEEDFQERVKGEGLEIYKRWNTLGVQDIATGRKHRLKTLGLLEVYKANQERWELIVRRENEFEAIQVEKWKEIIKEIGFKEGIKDLIINARDKIKEAPETIKQRSARFTEIIKLKRINQRELKIKMQSR